MTRASACGSSWLSVESRRVALATIATPSRADAPRRRPVAAVRHATAAEAPATHWAGRQKARAALASATRLMSESDRASFAAYDVEFVVEISRCRAPLHRSTSASLCPAPDVELYSSTALWPLYAFLCKGYLYSLHHILSGPSIFSRIFSNIENILTSRRSTETKSRSKPAQNLQNLKISVGIDPKPTVEGGIAVLSSLVKTVLLLDAAAVTSRI